MNSVVFSDQREANSFNTNYTRPVDIKKLRFIHRHLQLEKPRRLLEFGCGRGNILMSIVDCEEVVGVEISDTELKKSIALGLNVRSGNARLYKDGQLYDFIIASEVIEHVLGPEQLLENIVLHLRPRGLLILTCPNGFGPWEMRKNHLNPMAYIRRSNAVRRLLGKPPYIKGDSQDHCQWFTMGRIKRLAAESGLSLIEQQNSDCFTGGRLDVKLASRLPAWAASGWFFAFRYSGKTA